MKAHQQTALNWERRRIRKTTGAATKSPKRLAIFEGEKGTKKVGIKQDWLRCERGGGWGGDRPTRRGKNKVAASTGQRERLLKKRTQKNLYKVAMGGWGDTSTGTLV